MNLFEYEEENGYKLVRVGSFWRHICIIEYESSGDRNKTMS